MSLAAIIIPPLGYKVSTKLVMMQWLQALLPRWSITNLTSDWKDGRSVIVASLFRGPYS